MLFIYRFPVGFDLRDALPEGYELTGPKTVPTEEDLRLLREALVSREPRSPKAPVYHYYLKTWEGAQALAMLLQDLPEVGGAPEKREKWLPTDAGRGVSPRYGVTRLPMVGEPISYAFNGDYYPDGFVEKVGAGPKAVVVSTTGHRYYRRKQSSTWLRQGGTWALVHGHIERLNPEF